ncbi:hypothetical protein HNQ38_001239 [Desulfovibrio intestinalis]|uniref:Uncharacterized protein n=1 Tax=Desulfovibrio intestinalis TaxID=58621 RepID=A0A7W8FFR5_9BACT|nr:hypothetical protein [Desulfovibrio intestinalis]
MQPTLSEAAFAMSAVYTRIVQFQFSVARIIAFISACTKIRTLPAIVSMVTDCKGVLCCTLNLCPLHCTCILKAAARLPGHTPQPGKQEAL